MSGGDTRQPPFDQIAPTLRSVGGLSPFGGAELAVLAGRPRARRASISSMSANQTTAARVSPARRAVSRGLGRLLEENGPLVMVVAAFGLVMLLALRNALTIDGWMALASGREIAQHGLPTHDTLTVWTHGQRWIDQQWLAQFLLYRLWQAGGIKLVLLIHALLATGALAGAAAAARRLGGSARTTTWCGRRRSPTRCSSPCSPCSRSTPARARIASSSFSLCSCSGRTCTAQ